MRSIKGRLLAALDADGHLDLFDDNGLVSRIIGHWVQSRVCSRQLSALVSTGSIFVSSTGRGGTETDPFAPAEEPGFQRSVRGEQHCLATAVWPVPCLVPYF
jgi:hypothetical protein